MREIAIDSKRGQIATEARTRTSEQHEWRCLSESASLRKNHIVSTLFYAVLQKIWEEHEGREAPPCC